MAASVVKAKMPSAMKPKCEIDVYDTSRFMSLCPMASRAPVLAGVFLIAGLASLALPGTNSFVSEFLVLIGSFPTVPVYTIIATVGIILAALYILLMYQRTMHGPFRGVLAVAGEETAPGGEPVPAPVTGGATVATATLPVTEARSERRSLDLDRRELAVVAPLVALILVLGFYPQPLLNLIEPAVAATMQDVGVSPHTPEGTN